MKKLLMSLLVGGFSYLAAADAAAAEVRDGTVYRRLAVAGGGDMVEYTPEGTSVPQLFPVEHKRTWHPGTDVSTCIEEEYFSVVEHGNPVKKLIKSPSEVIFVRVHERPVTLGDRKYVLWPVQERLTCERQHHVPLDSKQLTQWELKQGFKMYKGYYNLIVTQAYGIFDGTEEPAFVMSVTPEFTRGPKVTGKKDKDTWFNDPSGQGSNGLEPSTQEEINAEFRELFPKFAAYI